MKSGYLYVLAHPSGPSLYKIGQTTRKPEERLAQHNSNYEELAGQIVKETGQKWKLKECFAVPDPVYAEAMFWEAVHTMAAGPERGKVEVITWMGWESLQMCLNEAKKAGMRPLPKLRTRPVRNREWMIKQLEETGITMIGHYRGLVTGVEFQCVKGHVFKKSAGVVAYSKSCPLCGMTDFSNKSNPSQREAPHY